MQYRDLGLCVSLFMTTFHFTARKDAGPFPLQQLDNSTYSSISLSSRNITLNLGVSNSFHPVGWIQTTGHFLSQKTHL